MYKMNHHAHKLPRFTLSNRGKQVLNIMLLVGLMLLYAYIDTPM